MSYLVLQFGDDSEVVEGTYSYLTPEGEEVEVSYTANENGYFPSVRLVSTIIMYLHCQQEWVLLEFGERKAWTKSHNNIMITLVTHYIL